MNVVRPERNVLIEWGTILSVGIIAGLSLGWTLWRPKPQATPKLTPAPAIVQSDKSVILATDPTRPAKPAQQLPKGAIVDRAIHVEVQPFDEATITTPGSSATALQPMPSAQPSPFAIDLTLYHFVDGSGRVVASSPNGTVIPGASIDIPSPPAPKVREPLKWCVGAVRGVSDTMRSTGAFVDRDFAFARVGIEATRNVYTRVSRTEWEARLKLGICF